MRIGIVTDAHSNPWGQEAVIRYLRSEGIGKENTFDLGDLVGMFPRFMDTVRNARAESGHGILGNHDAMLLRYFDDNPKREERIAALNHNRADMREDPEGVAEYLRSLPTSMRMGGISFVHNSLFHTNSYSEAEMHARFEPYMKNPGEKDFDLKTSLIARISQLSDQIIIRGHAHEAFHYKVRRGLTEPVPNAATRSNKPREGSVSTKGDKWVVPLDPDFKYVLVSGSACGANTIFTPDNKLDYRPAGLIVDYDIATQSGEATFLTVVEGYDHQKFINSVTQDERWKSEVFAEARKQVEHLQAGTLLGDH